MRIAYHTFGRIDVDEWLDEIAWTELRECLEFFAIEPSGSQMDDLRAGMMTAQLSSRLDNITGLCAVSAMGPKYAIRKGWKPKASSYTNHTFVPWLNVGESEQHGSSIALSRPSAEKGIHTASQWNSLKQGFIATCAAVRSNG